MNKKAIGAIEGIQSLIIPLIGIGIVLTVGFLIIAEAQDQIVSISGINETNISTHTVGYNATRSVQTALSDIPGWLPIIVITMIGAILLGLVSYFRGQQ